MLVALSARAWTVYPWEVGSYWCWIQGKKREYHVRSRFSLTCIYHSSLLRTWRVGLVMLGSHLILKSRSFLMLKIYFGSFARTRIKTDMSQAYIREKELAKSMCHWMSPCHDLSGVGSPVYQPGRKALSTSTMPQRIHPIFCNFRNDGQHSMHLLPFSTTTRTCCHNVDTNTVSSWNLFSWMWSLL